MDENLTLEQANDLLEDAIKQLENEALSMDESVALYVRACDLMAFCLKALEGCKEKINIANEKLAQYITEEADE